MNRIIQHDSTFVSLYEDLYSRRIRVDDYSGNSESILQAISSSLPTWTEKLIIKARPSDVHFFTHNGFTEEAMIGGYFSGIDMHFMTKYLVASRGTSTQIKKEEEIIRTLLSTPLASEPGPSITVEFATEADADKLARLYSKSFKIYPTPVHDPLHIKKTMAEGTVYVITRYQDEIISAASAEINDAYHNAELTDCATAAGYEGQGLMRTLLSELEHHLRSRGITCLYTIARSESFGMNKAFYLLGYTYGGRMTKNCMIYSGLEDMNVWWKKVGADPR